MSAGGFNPGNPSGSLFPSRRSSNEVPITFVPPPRRTEKS